MKPISLALHPTSALAGMVLLALVWVTAAAMPSQGSSSTRDVSAIEDINSVHPRDYVRFSGSQPYVVPAGKILVATAHGFSNKVSGGWARLSVDGVPRAVVQSMVASGTTGQVSGMVGLPHPGVVAGPGQTVSASASDEETWGYLVDA